MHCARGSPLRSTAISGTRSRLLLSVTLNRPDSASDLFRHVGGAQRRPARLSNVTAVDCRSPPSQALHGAERECRALPSIPGSSRALPGARTLAGPLHFLQNWGVAQHRGPPQQA